MPQNKINILDKKIPLNLSVRRVIKVELEKKCQEFEMDKNALVESLIFEWLNELEREDNDQIK